MANKIKPDKYNENKTRDVLNVAEEEFDL